MKLNFISAVASVFIGTMTISNANGFLGNPDRALQAAAPMTTPDSALSASGYLILAAAPSAETATHEFVRCGIVNGIWRFDRAYARTHNISLDPRTLVYILRQVAHLYPKTHTIHLQDIPLIANIRELSASDLTELHTDLQNAFAQLKLLRWVLLKTDDPRCAFGCKHADERIEPKKLLEYIKNLIPEKAATDAFVCHGMLEDTWTFDRAYARTHNISLDPRTLVYILRQVALLYPKTHTIHLQDIPLIANIRELSASDLTEFHTNLQNAFAQLKSLKTLDLVVPLAPESPDRARAYTHGLKRIESQKLLEYIENLIDETYEQC